MKSWKINTKLNLSKWNLIDTYF